MKRFLILASIASALALFALPSQAAKPLVFGAVGGNGVWLTGPTAQWPADAEAQGTGWASISPHLDLGADVQYGFSHAYLAGEGWVKVTATDVENKNFNMFLSAGYRGGSVAALQPSEFALGAGFGFVPFPAQFPRLLVTGRAERGQQSGLVISRFGARYYFPFTF